MYCGNDSSGKRVPSAKGVMGVLGTYSVLAAHKEINNQKE
jgi:hypothetical protein